MPDETAYKVYPDTLPFLHSIASMVKLTRPNYTVKCIVDSSPTHVVPLKLFISYNGVYDIFKINSIKTLLTIENIKTQLHDAETLIFVKEFATPIKTFLVSDKPFEPDLQKRLLKRIHLSIKSIHKFVTNDNFFCNYNYIDFFMGNKINFINQVYAIVDEDTIRNHYNEEYFPTDDNFN